jgi:hypothetical protein
VKKDSAKKYEKWIYTEFAKKLHWQIKLNKFEKRILNLFNFFDYFVNAKNLRRFYTKKPSPFEKYFQRFQPKTKREKAIIIDAVKLDITKKMIFYRKTPKFKVYLKKSIHTPCGWIRLAIAIFHK